MVDVADARPTAPGPPPAFGVPAMEVLIPAKRNRRQRQAAEAITVDARCTPVLVRAAIVGKARMPRAALEITRPDGTVVGNVALPNTADGFDLQQRFWLIGDPTPGSVVALVSEGRRQVILPGSRLRSGPVVEPEWSPLACRMLGWERPTLERDAPQGFRSVFSDHRASVDSPQFARAVQRFRTAAVTVPMLFVAVCFPYLFIIPWAIRDGYSAPLMLALPVVGGLAMTLWSAKCRQDLAAEAELIEAGAERYGKEIAFTQSYWASMRRGSEPWDGPVPAGAV